MPESQRLSQGLTDVDTRTVNFEKLLLKTDKKELSF